MDLLDSFYKESALTIEGLDPNSIKSYADYLDENCGLNDNAVFYVISGAYMNSVYNLFGSNAYPDDLNIVVIRLNNLKNYSAIIMKRFEFGGRWFDDIVDNNARRAAHC
jgi:hypothetical protein